MSHALSGSIFETSVDFSHRMKPPSEHMKHSWLLAILGLIGSACTSYTVKTIPIEVPTNYVNTRAARGVTVAADVYGTADRYQAVFDTAPSYERGYLGINLVFFNDS